MQTSFFRLGEHLKNRKVHLGGVQKMIFGILGILIILAFLIIHIFHCLGSHAGVMYYSAGWPHRSKLSVVCWVGCYIKLYRTSPPWRTSACFQHFSTNPAFFHQFVKASSSVRGGRSGALSRSVDSSSDRKIKKRRKRRRYSYIQMTPRWAFRQSKIVDRFRSRFL